MSYRFRRANRLTHTTGYSNVGAAGLLPACESSPTSRRSKAAVPPFQGCAAALQNHLTVEAYRRSVCRRGAKVQRWQRLFPFSATSASPPLCGRVEDDFDYRSSMRSASSKVFRLVPGIEFSMGYGELDPNGVPACSPRVPSLGECSLGNQGHLSLRFPDRNAVPSRAIRCRRDIRVTEPR